MRLSAYTGDYKSRASIIERKSFTASAGDVEYQLLSVEGVEEVYVDGLRKIPLTDYVFADGVVTMTAAMTGSESVLLIGRSDQQDFQVFNSAVEQQTLGNGQLSITLNSLTTEGIEVYVSGVNESRKLISGTDYTITGDDSLTLTSSFVSGTVIEIYQGIRPAWPNPDDFMVYDGKSTMRLSDRLAATMIDADYENGQGRFYMTAAAGTYIQRYDNKIPSTEGYFTSLLYDGVFWDPEENYSIAGAITSISSTDPLEVTILGTDSLSHTYTFYRRPSVTRRVIDSTDVIKDGTTELVVSSGETVTLTMAARDNFILIIEDQGGTINLPASWNVAGSFTPGSLVVYRGVRYGSTWLVEGTNF